MLCFTRKKWTKNTLITMLIVMLLSSNIVFAVDEASQQEVLQPEELLTEAVSKGFFNVVNVKNENTTITITEADTSEIPTILVPHNEVDIKVTALCNAQTGLLSKMDLKMWWDESGNKTAVSNYNDVAVMDGANAIKISWDKSTNVPVIDCGNDTTWQLVLEKCVLPTVEQLSNPEITKHDFVFRVKIGKVARMTEDDSRWQIAAQVFNDIETSYGYYLSQELAGLEMAWYAEVQSPGEVRWGNISQGIGYENSNAKTRVNGIRYITNGHYNEQVKFDNNWYVGNGEISAVLSQEPLAKNEFALKISSSDDLTSAKQIPGDGKYVITAEANPPTTFEGKVRDDYYLFIRLNENFEAGLYSGNITFGISN